MRLKANEGDFRAALARHQRREVYHWTPAARLPSVLTHGILCRRELDRRGIAYDGHSYGTAGKDKEFEGHVCVSFYPHKGMMKQATGAPAIIVMSSIVVAAEGAFYCPENTAKNEYEFTEISSHTQVEHLDELFAAPDAWELVDWQAEVWIPEGIPVDRFSHVLFRTTEEREAAVAACAPIAASLPRDIGFVVGTWQFPAAPPEPAPSSDDELPEWLR